MTATESSSTRVPYDLRPRKQIERRMMIHALQLIAEAGFKLSKYRYVGFGAFFFVDFMLFRRMLGINDMVSIEHDEKNSSRVYFNRPFGDIDIVIGNSTEYLEKISPVTPHLIWLDYDGAISFEKLTDLDLSMDKLCSGSILIITVDVDFDKATVEIRDSLPQDRAKLWLKLFREECGDLFDPTWDEENFTAKGLAETTTKVLSDGIKSGLTIRNNIVFSPLFNFLYRDGHDMLTIGGMITSPVERGKLKRVDWQQLPFVRRDLSKPPFVIDLPIFTRRERLYIDSNMPCPVGWQPTEIEFSQEEISIYRDVYRYCPLYAELFI